MEKLRYDKLLFTYIIFRKKDSVTNIITERLKNETKIRLYYIQFLKLRHNKKNPGYRMSIQ